ncbi:MAG TPA: hypothetical protein VGP92_01800 [Acidimicrobiia bacterium]|nr:hypothetical protein [Acidimicrobiia bacterium]
MRILAAVIAASLSVGVSYAAAGPVGAVGEHRTPTPLGRLSVLARGSRDRVAALGMLLPAAPEVALGAPIPSMTVHDVKGDALFPQGDLTGVGMLQNASGTAFGATVNAVTNPATDANWLAGNVALDWFLDANRDGVPDYVVVLADTTSQKVVAFVTDLNFSQLFCTATPKYIPLVGYRVTAPPGCIPHLTTARFLAGMIYDDVFDPNAPVDFAPDNGLSATTVVQEAAPRVGYWMLGSDGRVYPFGGAVGFPGSVAGAVAMAPRHDGKGYWVVDFLGHVFTYGTAKFFGGAPALGSGEFVSTISATPSGGGYWLFTNKGRAFAFGNASSFGDMSGAALNGPIVASVATPTGHGYYMVGSDGGIFCFGDARFHGSTGGLHLNKPVVGISPTADGKGYWLVGSDGGVFAFNAPFRGSMGGTPLNQSVDGLVAFGNGYLMAAADGGVFDFSNKPFLGSLANNPPSAPIIGLAAFTT